MGAGRWLTDRRATRLGRSSVADRPSGQFDLDDRGWLTDRRASRLGRSSVADRPSGQSTWTRVGGGPIVGPVDLGARRWVDRSSGQSTWSFADGRLVIAQVECPERRGRPDLAGSRVALAWVDDHEGPRSAGGLETRVSARAEIEDPIARPSRSHGEIGRFVADLHVASEGLAQRVPGRLGRAPRPARRRRATADRPR